ncbi:MAG: ArdC family protein [Acidimicrobiia bacterium]
MNYSELASHVTARLVARIEAGAGCWSMPWHTNPGLLDVRNAATGLPYRGANTITLAVAALDCGYPAGWWATYRQWSELGAQVRRGETAARIVKWVPGRATDDSDSDGRRLVPMVYAVFNAAQVDGWTPPAASTPTVLERNQHADAWIAATQADITYGHHHACYRPGVDRIELPAAEQFTESAAFYSTACHELVHWTGHRTRLGRDLTGRFGDDSYAAEELVAELGAAIACAHLAIAPSTRDDHAAYLAHWLRILGEDPKALFAVAAKAQTAVDHLDAYSSARLADDEAAA